MSTKAKTVDEFIDRAEPFAIPILMHLRELVHKACPEVVETIKWQFPVFVYQDSILCMIAAFKAHCSFGFWKSGRLKDPAGILQIGEKTGAGDIGRIVSLKDLPGDKILIAYIKEAAALATEKPKIVTPAKKKAAKESKVPEALSAALKKNKKAQAAFLDFSASSRNEYSEWISEAKSEATRQKRVATAVEWLAEGKKRHWKYQNKQDTQI